MDIRNKQGCLHQRGNIFNIPKENGHGGPQILKAVALLRDPTANFSISDFVYLAMTFEQRKIDLISWISQLDNEERLVRMQKFKNNSSLSIPSEIISLLDESNNAKLEDLREHTSTKDLIT